MDTRGNAPNPDQSIGPSGICKARLHDWQHPEPGSKRRICTHCGSMSMRSYCDCDECGSRAATP